ncbi:hypothetical protein PFISCL1PPCAC_11935 [Pristionchus fissidentatus]|uniref:BZIP domain-containing protein n=1 Tax=Pristionchus fissidentatus TaxID=1538716 RepID=A0AAV5VQM8_9BILA|nr:hypothetical protein PFISCL1PPCAC_11935 [Pristionchus fissidentatus]
MDPDDLHDGLQPLGGGEDVLSEDEARRRREQLNRRPSYRMILKDLEGVGDKAMKKEPEDSPPSSVPSALGGGSTVDTTPGTSNSHLIPTSTGPGDSLHVQIPRSCLPSTSSSSQLPPSSMASNGAMGSSPYNSPLSSQLLLGHANPLNALNGSDLTLGGLDYGGSVAAAAALVAVTRGQITPNSSDLFSSAFEGSTGDMHALKGMQDLQAPGSFTPGVSEWSSLMSQGYSSSPSPPGHGMGGGGEDEGTRKRQVRLLKNREAAKECRRKKKEYVKCLENRVAVLENQNKALIEELKALKELYCRKEKSEM